MGQSFFIHQAGMPTPPLSYP